MPRHALQPDPTPAQRCWRRYACALAAWCVGLTGCGSHGPSLGLDEIEQQRLRNRTVEVSLGEYSIPIPAVSAQQDGQLKQTNLLLLRFKLWALVSPQQQSIAERLIERHRGTLRDRVFTICRRSPLSDLQDPNLTALRSRLLDGVQPLFEGRLLKRVGVTDVLTDPL